MTELIGLRVLGGLLAAFVVSGLARRLVRPTPRLAGRVRPYTAASRSVLGRMPDRNLIFGAGAIGARGVLRHLYRPIVESLVGSFMSVFGSAFDDGTLALRLEQAGVLHDVPAGDRVHEYRVRQVGAGLTWGTGLSVLATVAGVSPGLLLGVFVLGVVIGVGRRSGRVGSKIDDRRSRMRVELYTVNQLLAIYLRTSGSPILAAQRLVRRGRGAMIDELNEALRHHARGMSASRAFSRIADQTPEPYAARTYKLLASGSERGADLASALLSLSEDVRNHRRTEVRRTATKRQGAMLLPIILFLAPVMLIFIAAPLPSLIFGSTN